MECMSDFQLFITAVLNPALLLTNLFIYVMGFRLHYAYATIILCGVDITDQVSSLNSFYGLASSVEALCGNAQIWILIN